MLLGGFGGMFLSFSLLYRIYVGPGNYPCDIHVWRFLGLPLIAGPILTRTALFYARTRFNQLMVDLDESQATVLEQYRNLSSPNVLRVFLGWVGDICSLRRRRVSMGDGDRSSIGRREDRVLLLFIFTTNAYGVLIWIGTLIVAFVYIAVLHVINESPLGRGCLGCGSSSFETVYLGVVLLSMAGLGAFLLWRIRFEEDPLGIVAELRLALWCFVPFVFLSLLTAIDPGDLAREGIFSWSEMMPLNIAAVHFVQCPLQLLRCRQKSSAALCKIDSATQSADNHSAPQTLEEVLAVPSGRHTFMRFLAKEWSVENLYFHDAVLRFRNLHRSRDQALKIYRTFVADGAIFQVNISSASRSAIHQALETNVGSEPSEDLFDEADGEVFLLMRTDSFERFIRSAIFHNWVEEFGLRAPAPGLAPTANVAESA
ncbi:Regulator of G-protein signaling loco [Hondaea fermentalgiana]|uniref:Regulator of G-protein signaling loco n=1 Tax=Hondaea fermentalgiana TaxID=2315210 RepID=A0A2R5GHK1_9STRA|nr:Regulator of G-protein signaling loco [Hondaea fermentalgiana]|eukprot:GBG30362.1 Regulator of G-protein signaling loco [Hondaea fermentalgiana]